MWWEALPSMAVIGVSLFLMSASTYVTNRLFLGNPYKRNITRVDEGLHYLRDMRISGVDNAYKQIGLDCLNCEPDPPCECP